jgi:signal transduction histidine kinase
MTVMAALFNDSLPFAFPPVPADADSVTELEVFSGHPVKIAIDLVTAACYAIGAVAFARLADRTGDAFIAWLGIGSTIAAGAFINYALIPSRFTELIYGGEILWIFAVGAFWYGAISEISNLEAALVRSAVRSERKRVARDLHDGVVQELAYISTQAGWLLDRAEGQPHEQPIRRIRDAVDRALDESRGAIAALNREMDEPLHQAVGNAAMDVATRVGVDLDLDLDPSSRASSEWRDALIRIAREAVGNAVRHGGATEVRLGLSGDPAVLTVGDDGKGFDPTSPRSPQSFGLQSMRERAESLGGDFELESSPGHGTTVRVTLTRSG